MTKESVSCWGLGVIGMIAITTRVAGHSIAVDVDVVTPGIQSFISVLPGTVVPVDIHLVDDGLFTPVTGYGLATNFNDAGPALGVFAPTVAGAFAGGLLAPTDLVAGTPAAVGLALAPVGFPAFGFGPGGAFTGTNGGTGFYELGGGAFGPNPPFALPGIAGFSVVLETITFVAVGTPGMSSDVAPLGILAASPAIGAAPPIGGPFGLEFYDNSGGAPGGLGSYPAGPTGPFGPTPSFPGGVPGGLPPLLPGTIMIVPEPDLPLLFAGAVLFWGFLRRRRAFSSGEL